MTYTKTYNTGKWYINTSETIGAKTTTTVEEFDTELDANTYLINIKTAKQQQLTLLQNKASEIQVEIDSLNQIV